MNRPRIRLSATALSLLGAFLSSQASAYTETADPEAPEVAGLLEELNQAGYIDIDTRTGQIHLKESVLTLLKASGIASEMDHPTDQQGACDRTTGITDSLK